MRGRVIQRVLGLLLTVFSITLLPPAVLAYLTKDGALSAFVEAFLFNISLGAALWLPVRAKRFELRLRDGFMVVVLFWTVLGLTGSIPFAAADQLNMSIADAVFESMSGLTTTGATVIVGLDALPVSILFYRQQLQWMGGMGIIVLAVAILPMLGIGGMQLYRAETPGPMKDTKLTPRITETAKALWYIYLGLTVLCAGAYFAAGMGAFDAIAHSFSTIAIGGFSTHDQSFAYFDSPLIEAVAITFMLLSGINFSLHFLTIRSRSLETYRQDSELRAYLLVLGTVFILATVVLITHASFDSWTTSVRHGLFQAVSIGTTTGFTTNSYYLWPTFLPLMLILASFVGGCAGSTGGGIKVIRIMLLFKQGGREIHRLVHPNALIPIKIGAKAVPDRIVDAVWGFFSAYLLSFFLILLVLMATGLDQVTAFSAVAACINNLGPGLGTVGQHYGDISDTAKYVLSFAMILGRLEIFTLLVLLTPTFWRN